jgi:hypothetical protein
LRFRLQQFSALIPLAGPVDREIECGLVPHSGLTRPEPEFAARRPLPGSAGTKPVFRRGVFFITANRRHSREPIAAAFGSPGDSLVWNAAWPLSWQAVTKKELGEKPGSDGARSFSSDRSKRKKSHESRPRFLIRLRKSFTIPCCWGIARNAEFCSSRPDGSAGAVPPDELPALGTKEPGPADGLRHSVESRIFFVPVPTTGQSLDEP